MRTIAQQIGQNVVNQLYDKIITKDIVRALNQNTYLNGDCTIKVAVHQGVVTLTGAVPDRVARKAAYETALATIGVVDIENQLVIK